MSPIEAASEITDNSSLTSDCGNCAALCCLAMAIDEGPKFAFDKPGGTPCQHLVHGGGCKIHDQRISEGMSGCIDYECAGAGQYVTQVLFDGATWQDDAELIEPMSRAFHEMARIQQALLLLSEARNLPLPYMQLKQVEDFRTRLKPVGGWALEDLDAGAGTEIEAQVNAFLRNLAEFV